MTALTVFAVAGWILIGVVFFAGLVALAIAVGRHLARRPEPVEPEQEPAPWLPRRFGPDGNGASRPPVAPYLGQPDLRPRARSTWNDEPPAHRSRSDVKAERAERDTGEDTPDS